MIVVFIGIVIGNVNVFKANVRKGARAYLCMKVLS